MKNLTFESMPDKGAQAKIKLALGLIKIDRPRCVLFTCLTFNTKSKYLPACSLTSSNQLLLVAGKIQVPTNHQCACVYEFQTASHLVFQKY